MDSMATDYGDLAPQPDAPAHGARDAERRHVLETLERAQTWLATALRRLHALRLDMLLGMGDSEQYDAVLLDYRAAQAALREAQAAKDGLASNGIPEAEPSQDHCQRAAIEPTARLHFARWLVEHGRLSEWNVRAEEVTPDEAPPARLAFTRWLVQTGRLSDYI